MNGNLYGVARLKDGVTVSAALANLQAQLLSVVAERTGYPPEMLGLDQDLEAELGIDSIKRVEILGAPVVSLDIACDKPTGMIAARLEDVSPNGASTLVSYGLLNLTHRYGHEEAVLLVPGKRFGIRLAPRCSTSAKVSGATVALLESRV